MSRRRERDEEKLIELTFSADRPTDRDINHLNNSTKQISNYSGETPVLSYLFLIPVLSDYQYSLIQPDL